MLLCELYKGVMIMSNSYPFIHYLCSKQVNYPHGNINKT